MWLTNMKPWTLIKQSDLVSPPSALTCNSCGEGVRPVVLPGCLSEENCRFCHPACACSLQPFIQGWIFRSCCVIARLQSACDGSLRFIQHLRVFVFVHMTVTLSLSNGDPLASSKSQPESCPTLTSGACVRSAIVPGQEEAPETAHAAHGERLSV